MPDRRRARLGFLLVAVIFGATCLAWIDRIPFDQTPDEWTHYYYNVRVMLDEHRIPRVGVDDMRAEPVTASQ